MHAGLPRSTVPQNNLPCTASCLQPPFTTAHDACRPVCSCSHCHELPDVIVFIIRVFRILLPFQPAHIHSRAWQIYTPVLSSPFDGNSDTKMQWPDTDPVAIN